MDHLVRRLKLAPRFLGSISIISLLALRNPVFFRRILSDTNRSFNEAWGFTLPSITPQALTGVTKTCQLLIDRERISIGIGEILPILEIVHLSRAKRILEIGTSSGGTTWHLAANMAVGGTVITVDLPPTTSTSGNYSPANLATERPTQTQLGRAFQGTSEEASIRLVLTDSAKLTQDMVGEKVDIVFIDGAHTYEHAKSDTETAMKLLKPGGYLMWHDYFVFHPDYGVYRYLHELAQAMPIYRLCDSLAAVARLPE